MTLRFSNKLPVQRFDPGTQIELLFPVSTIGREFSTSCVRKRVRIRDAG